MVRVTSFSRLRGVALEPGGLVEDDVRKQCRAHGPNDILGPSASPLAELAKGTAKDPMISFLLGTGLLFWFTGEEGQSVLLFASILPLVAIDAYLLRRVQASMASLRSQLATRALVVRDGTRREIPCQDIVPGDVVVLSRASEEHVPADGVFVESEGLQVDESVLTGEAMPLPKVALVADLVTLRGRDEVPLEERHLGFAGTRVVAGTGLLRVLQTGRQTSYGEIVQAALGVSREKTHLQKEIESLVRLLTLGAAMLALVLAAVRYLQGFGAKDAILSAATFAIAALPEEFPLAYSFLLGVGAYRLAKRRALVRRAVAIEELGRVTWICADKTGTLTSGILELSHVLGREGLTEREVVRCALDASEILGQGDPVDTAIGAWAERNAVERSSVLRTFPFTEDRRRHTAFIDAEHGERWCVSKGAPESVLAMTSLAPVQRAEWEERVRQLAEGGHKVLATAKRRLSDAECAEGLEPGAGFEFVGLLAFEDLPRIGVAASLARAREGGIRVLMLTGDHPSTAAAVAKEIGLGSPVPVVVSAAEDASFRDEGSLLARREILSGLDVVARCTPLQKLAIVRTLRNAGEIVAVTGDGVNDVPALKAADVGVSMGGRGTRSAKEVASILLLDDDFTTLVHAIEEGRQLGENLRASFLYLFLLHVPFVATAAVIPLLGFPLAYLPIHVVWIELVVHPTALFAFQQRNTRSAWGPLRIERRTLLSRRDAAVIGVMGVGLGCVIVAAFARELAVHGPAHARAVAMGLLLLWSAATTLVLTRGRNAMAAFVGAAVIASAVGLIQASPLVPALWLSPLSALEWLGILSVVSTFALALAMGLNARSPHPQET